ncbi:hypothetical protein, partial [Verminephrobacter aporrectodeae]|uniref:hypothetical protein n=1 Tax=Verminephrobacter aporrectodeae TaxID=1110389 RepID=UPI002243DCA2
HMLGHLLGKTALVQFAALTDQAQRSVLRDLMAGNGDIEHLTTLLYLRLGYRQCCVTGIAALRQFLLDDVICNRRLAQRFAGMTDLPTWAFARLATQ